MSIRPPTTEGIRSERKRSKEVDKMMLFEDEQPAIFEEESGIKPAGNEDELVGSLKMWGRRFCGRCV